MDSKQANRALLSDSLRRIFFGERSGVCLWRMEVHNDAARRALHNLGGLAAAW